jgi:C-terminal processing protease CtpA/Prc
VPASATLTAGAAQVGYIVLKDFIVQAEPELSTRLNAIKAAGATDLIIDLRYNGGGRISTANLFASEVLGPRGVFTTLQYNTKQQASNRSFTLTASSAPGVFNRIVVLTGQRSCSASELLVNGLRPYAQQVSTVGDTSCGKPYGFNPVDSCSNTFSIVNFKAVNALGQGDYEAGITPTCAVAEDFSGAFGDPSEKLTAAALSYLQTGTCPATAAAPADRARTLGARLQRAGAEPGERRGMTAD